MLMLVRIAIGMTVIGIAVMTGVGRLRRVRRGEGSPVLLLRSVLRAFVGILLCASASAYVWVACGVLLLISQEFPRASNPTAH